MKKKKILIVDDDMDYLFQMRLKVEQMGFETITAESQAEAEKIILEIKPDLCILDLMMESDDSGFILSYKIKRKYPDVPVIIVTAYDEPASRECAKKYGAVAFLRKPVDSEALIDLIKYSVNPV